MTTMTEARIYVACLPDAVGEALEEAARAAGPGPLAQRLVALAADYADEVAGEDPATEHDYRGELREEIARLEDDDV